MADTKRIEVIIGPMSGHMLDVPTDQADKAISEGWARDPLGFQIATPPTRTAEEQAKLIELATAGAAQLQGAGTNQREGAERPASGEPRATRAMEGSGTSSRYPTRSRD